MGFRLNQTKLGFRLEATELAALNESEDHAVGMVFLSPASYSIAQRFVDLIDRTGLWEGSDEDLINDLRECFRSEMSITIDFNDLIDAFRDVADALTNQKDCCCGGGSGYYGPAPALNVGDEVPINTRDGVDPPPVEMGDTWAEFDVNLCAHAHALVDVLKENVKNVRFGFNMFVAATGAAGAVFTFAALGVAYFPPAGALLAIFVAIAALVSAAELDDAIDDIEASREDLVCAIVGASGPAAAKAAWDSEIEALFSAPVAAVVKSLTWMDVFNAVFNGTLEGQALEISERNEDCSFCQPSQSGSVFPAFSTTQVGFTTDGDDQIIEISSYQKPNGTYYAALIFGLDPQYESDYDEETEQTSNIPSSKLLPVDPRVRAYESTGATQVGVTNFYRTWDGDGANAGGSPFFNDSSMNDPARVVIFTSSSPFTAVVTVEFV